MRIPWLRRVASSLLLIALGAAKAQEDAVLVTVVDGPATVIQGLNRLESVEGLRLRPGDVVRTAADARWLRLEWPGGEHLSLGPDSELMLAPRLPAARGKPAAYLLRGWVKSRLALASAAVDIEAADGDYVLQLDNKGWQLFAESAVLALRPAGAARQSLATGAFLQRAEGKLQVLPRPQPGFIAALPRPFLDSLPPRASQFAGRKPPQPKSLGAPSYGDLRAWLLAEPVMRQNLLPRWRPLLRDAAFRLEMDKNLALHPEWRRILYPPPAAASAP